MDRKKTHKKITAIVPAYNEADRIRGVLDVLVSHPRLAEIIVVDDGSTDETENIVCQYDVFYIKNERNQGKGYAMDKGVKRSKGEIILFVDADVSGLTHEMVDQIIAPVADEGLDMFIGMRNRKIYYLHLLVVFVPLLGGERALTKTLWNRLPAYYKHRFRIEAGLNFYAEHWGKGFEYTVFKGLAQVVKEKKYGWANGLKQRFGMMWNIASAQYRLYVKDAPDVLGENTLESVVSGIKRKIENRRV